MKTVEENTKIVNKAIQDLKITNDSHDILF